jgi:hypothetical protein
VASTIALDLNSVQTWVALATAIVALAAAFAKGLSAWRARRLERKRRKGDLSAVAIEHKGWALGGPPDAMYDEARGSLEGAQFPMAVTNGSGDKVTNVRFGIRWREGGEATAGHVPVLLPGESLEGTAWEAIGDPEAFDPPDFDGVWLNRLVFFVRFTDQQGVRWENVLQDGKECTWTTREIRRS